MAKNPTCFLQFAQQAARIRASRLLAISIILSASVSLFLSTYLNDQQEGQHAALNFFDGRGIISYDNGSSVKPSKSVSSIKAQNQRIHETMPTLTQGESTNSSIEHAGGGRIILFLHLHKCVAKIGKLRSETSLQPHVFPCSPSL